MWAAALLKTLREREGQKQVEVDAELDAYLSACEHDGVQNAAATEMQLRLLGLEAGCPVCLTVLPAQRWMRQSCCLTRVLQ